MRSLRSSVQESRWSLLCKTQNEEIMTTFAKESSRDQKSHFIPPKSVISHCLWCSLLNFSLITLCVVVSDIWIEKNTQVIHIHGHNHSLDPCTTYYYDKCTTHYIVTVCLHLVKRHPHKYRWIFKKSIHIVPCCLMYYYILFFYNTTEISTDKFS